MNITLSRDNFLSYLCKITVNVNFCFNPVLLLVSVNECVCQSVKYNNIKLLINIKMLYMLIVIFLT